MDSRKPTEYFIYYENLALYSAEVKRNGGDWEVDPDLSYVTEDAKSRIGAYSMARRAARLNSTTVFIKRRIGIHDDTPSDFPVREYYWAWDDEEWVGEVGKKGVA